MNSNITITSNNTQSIQQTNLLSQSVSTLRKEILNVNTAIDKSTKSWTNLSLGYNAVIDLSKKAADSLKSVYQIGKEAAQLQEVSKYTELMASKAGLDFDKLVDASRRGAKGMATNAEVMKSNLKALRSGLKASENDFGSLWKIADAMSDQMGVSITQAFEQITTAIVTGNQKSLISMGIMPESFGRVSDAADLLTRRSETLKLVLSELGPQAEEVGNQGNTAADKFTQFETSLNNLKQNISEKFLPTSIALVDWLKDIVEYGGDAADALEWIIKGDSVFNLSDTRNLGVIGELDALRRQKEGLEKNRAEVVEKLKNTSEGTVKGFFTPQSSRMEWGEELDGYDRKLEEVNERIKELEKTGRNIVHLEQENAKEAARLAEEKKKAADEAERQKKAAEEAEKLAKKQREELEKQFAALSKQIDSGINKALGVTNQSLSDNITLMYNAGIAAMGFNAKVDEAAAAEYKLNQEAEKMADEFFKAFENASKLETSIENISHLDFDKALKNFDKKDTTNYAASLMLGTGSQYLSNIAGVVNYTAATGKKPDEVTKEGWKAIKSDFLTGTSDAIVSGIANSDLPAALASFGRSQASNYGSQLLGGLLSNGTKGLSGAFKTGGAGWGLVAGIAIDYVASNWKKWTGDKHKEETMAAVNDATARGSNAYLNTYKSELNPYISYEDLARIYQARSNMWTKGMTVSYEWKDTDWHWLTGSSSYSNTTPQSTYNVIAALEKANELAEKSATQKERELDLLSAQGYDYQVTKEQFQLLSSAVDRISLSERQFNWDNGESFSIDLSDNIQDLKKAYYEALREYGSETGARNQQKASTFMSLFPYLDDYNAGKYYWSPGEEWGLKDINDNASLMFSRVDDVQENLLNRYADPRMLKMVKQAGFEQFNLVSMQYTTEDANKYAEAYLNVLERQKKAAELVMQQQEQIYLDMTKTFDEQSAALDMYQQAQEQYYNTKLEILAQERAKEEQIKKQEAAATLRRQEQMEALLGFTGEIARTGNKVYILEGADQVGALKEMIQQYGDNPEALAALQAMLSAAQSKAKFGKIA